jgi:type II secretory pathway pseudopilin PulG
MKFTLNKMHSKKALTTLETVSLVAIFCVIAGSVFAWFSNYRLKTKAAEAQVNLKLIFNAEMAYYESSQPSMRISPDSLKTPPNTKQFLPLSPQPVKPSQNQQVGNFSSGDWSLLHISIPKPVYFSYSVETAGMGEEATFTAIAKGDLDGDRHFSRWEMLGSIDVTGQPIGGNIAYSLDPLE